MTVRVKVVQLGRRIRHCDVVQGSTVQEVLTSEGIPLDGMEVRVNSQSMALDRLLQDGDLITVVPLIKGGTTPRCARAHAAQGNLLYGAINGFAPQLYPRRA